MSDNNTTETEPIYANWSVELNAECPKCEEDVDLLEDPEFWHGNRGLQVGQETTIIVHCPKCGHEFTVKC